MKKILMLVHTFPPIGSVGGSIRIVKFLKYINELRTDIHSTIITVRDDITLLNDFKLSAVSESEIPKKNIKVIRTNTFQAKHPNPSQYNDLANKSTIASERKTFSIKSILKKIYKFLEKFILIPDYGILWFPFSLKSSLKEIKENKIDIIYATAPPFSVLLQAVILKKITKKKLILDIKDDWIYQTVFLARPLILRKVEKSLEKICIKNANKIILVTQKSLADYSMRYPEFKDKFELITNGCDTQEYSKYWTLTKKSNPKFTIIHSGVIAVSRDPSGFLKAISELKQAKIISKDNFEINFIGVLPINISELIVEMNLEDIVSSSKVLEREEYIKAISGADLLLAFNYQIKTLVPGKLYDYWGSRRPILLIDSSDSMASQLISENQLGVVKDFDDVRGMKEVIKNYFSLWERGQLNHNSDVENLFNYDRKNLTKKLLEIIDNV